MHDNSLLLFKKYAEAYFHDNYRVLEIGSTFAHSAYRKALLPRKGTWETLDIQQNTGAMHYSENEYSYPIKDNEYDIVIAGQVLEHVKKLWLWIHELKRITAPNGYIILINPISWPYHEAPVDCWRAYPEGMHALCEEANLDIILSKCESAEASLYGRTRAGKGRVSTSIKSRIKYCLLKPVSFFGYPIPVSYDTITIAKKTI